LRLCDDGRGGVITVDERQYYTEAQTKRNIRLTCPYCRATDEHELRWLVRTKKDRLPPGADERDRAKFQKAQSYMVLMDDRAQCKQMRCRKSFEISGIKTMAFL